MDAFEIAAQSLRVQRNEETIRAWYRALDEMDVDAALALVTDDVVLHVGGQSQVAGDYRGLEGLVTIAGRIRELTAGTHRTELIDVIGNASHAVARHRWTATRDGRAVDMVDLIVFQLVDGRIAERREYVEDDDAHDAFWS